jgi:uncharacterized protein YhaN
MRFDRLDLLRYGSLSNRSLSFRPGAKLHVIYGPNEAGKSTVLRALSDLLFGFANEVAGLHRFEPPHLRVGATLTRRDGASLSFRRRKGRKATLVSGSDDEKALADDILAPFLGSVSRRVFEQAFGMDSARLRQGGLEMTAGDGEIGRMLFSAASGFTGLTELRAKIETEADAIFGSRKSKDRSFYQALDRHEAARHSEKGNELRAHDWKRLTDEFRLVEAQLLALDGERLETKTRLDRLQHLRTVEPLVAEVDIELIALSQFDEISTVSDEVERRLAELLATLDTIAAQEATARDAFERIETELNSLSSEPLFLAQGDRILALFAQKGAYAQARSDIARVKAEVADFDLDLAGLGRRAGHIGSIEALVDTQPTDAQIAQLNTLVREGNELRRAAADLRQRLEQQAADLRRMERDDGAGEFRDVRALQERFAALQPDIRILQGEDQADVAAARIRLGIAEAKGRLIPPVVDLEILLSSPLPDEVELEKHRPALVAAADKVARSQERLVERCLERDEVTRQLQELESDGQLITRGMIEEARAVRDTALLEFRQGGPWDDVLSGTIVEADKLADGALSQAERTARHAQLALRLSRLESSVASGQIDLDAAQAHAEAMNSNFGLLFGHTGVQVLDIDQMAKWLRALTTIADKRRRLQEYEDECQLLLRRKAPVLSELTAIATELGLTDKFQGPLEAAVRVLAGKLDDLRKAWDDSRLAHARQENLRADIDDGEQKLNAAALRIETWRGQFLDACRTFGLHQEPTLEMAEAAIQVWKDIPRSHAERQNRQRRVDGMARDIEAFERNVMAVCEIVDPAIAKSAPETAVDLLHQRAVSAKSASERRDLLMQSRDRALADRGRIAQANDDVARDVEEILARLEVKADSRTLLDLLHQRSAVIGRLDECRRRLSLQSRGLAEPEIRNQLAHFDRFAAGLEIESLTASDSEQYEQFGRLKGRLAELGAIRDNLESGPSAEEAAFEKLAAEQDAQDLARQWAILKVASKLLSSSLERHRESQSDPLLLRAGEHFSALTKGSFTRLVQEFGDDDKVHIKAQRASGERIGPKALSEGAADQLYLALRLAYLEDYSSRNEAIPFVTDDVFQTFDDERKASGLTTLASSGHMFQPILFTHEGKIVEIARDLLGNDVDIIPFDRVAGLESVA